MNHVLPNTSVPTLGLDAWEESAKVRRLRSLLGLFALYAAALLTVIAISDGSDIGCILAGIAGHVFYATHRLACAFRADAWLDAARLKGRRRDLAIA